MHITRRFNQIKHSAPSVLTIGNFDGVHLGHKKIINIINQIAQENNLASTILTFQPHPARLFKPELASDFTISSLAQKLQIFQQEKIAHVVIAPFKRDFADISATDFIKKILVEALNVKHLVIGYDFIFGKNREGNLMLLQEAAKHYGFNIIKVEAHQIDKQICSSTAIRKFLQNGDITAANKILGHNFALEGIVVEGKKLARSLGFATANIKAKSHIIKPKFGVYKVRVLLDKKTHNGIMNFGIKPTIGGVLEPLYEIHIFNFTHNIYGKKITVELLDFIREEKKFESLDALREQIRIDCLAVNN